MSISIMNSYLNFCLVLCFLSSASQLESMQEAPLEPDMIDLIGHPALNAEPISIASLLIAQCLPRVDDEGYLDLSDLALATTEGIEHVPDQEHVLSLNISHNRLHSLPAAFFGHLTYLDISHNPIGMIAPGAFDNLALLRTFYARSIKLETLPPSLFCKLLRLKAVDLSGNELRELPQDLIAQNSALKKLHFHSNNLSRLEPLLLRNLTNLKSLHLAHNRIQSLPPLLCANLSKLRILDLTNNLLTEFEPHAFDGLVKLRAAFFGQNNIKQINSDTFSRCTALIELDLGDNQLSQLDAALIRPLTALQALILRGNKSALKESLSHETITLMKERSLYLADPFLIYDAIPERTVRDLFASLRAQGRIDELIHPHAQHEGFFIVNIANQRLTSLEGLDAEVKKEIPDLKSVSTLLAHNNYLTTLPCAELNAFSGLIILLLRCNLIESLSETPNCCLNLPNLNRLVLSHNKIKTLRCGSLRKIDELTTLKLDHNELELIEEGAFDHQEHLHTCFLMGNKLTAIPEQLFACETNDLRHLEFLDLSRNQLGSLQRYAFPKHTTVRFYPQDPQPLLSLAAHAILTAMSTQTAQEKLATLSKMPATYKNPLATMAPEATRKYLDLHGKIRLYTHMLDQINQDDLNPDNATHKNSLKAYEALNETVARLQAEEWPEGLALFLKEMEGHPIHRLFMRWLCEHMAGLFRSASLCRVGEIIKSTPTPLFNHYIDAACKQGLIRVAQAREIYDAYLELIKNWHTKQKSILTAQIRAMQEAINVEADIHEINQKWHDQFELFRKKLVSWSPEMRKNFFALTTTKLQGELARNGVMPADFAH